MNRKIKDLTDIADELYKEIEKNGYIERLKEIRQLGTIKIKKENVKTKLEYIELQLNLNNSVRKQKDINLKYGYGSKISNKEYLDKECIKETTVFDVIQLFIITYNIGHFYNTFASSKAVVMYANKDECFKNKIIKEFKEEKLKNVALKVIENKNYHHMHLINSLLILDKCDPEKESVIVAKEIIYNYINKNELKEKNKHSKLLHVFDVFRKIRDISFIVFDLESAKIPLKIDINDKESMMVILNEFLSEKNNNMHMKNFFESICKMLNDVLYNKPQNAIESHITTKKMLRELQKSEIEKFKLYYEDYFKNETSILNRSYNEKKYFDKTKILKITFNIDEKYHAFEFYEEIEKTQEIECAFYSRHDGKLTIVLSLKKSCKNKIKTSFKVLKLFVNFINSKLENIEVYDIRYLILVDYCLYYVFQEKRVEIKGIVDGKRVFGNRGEKQRIQELDKLLRNNIENKDAEHEIKCIKNYLEEDFKGDVSIVIPSSIEMFDEKNISISEFDGLVIFPNRDKEQVVFFEAKNSKKYNAKRSLKDKFIKFNIEFIEDKFIKKNNDIAYKYTIN